MTQKNARGVPQEKVKQPKKPPVPKPEGHGWSHGPRTRGVGGQWVSKKPSTASQSGGVNGQTERSPSLKVPSVTHSLPSTRFGELQRVLARHAAATKKTLRLAENKLRTLEKSKDPSTNELRRLGLLLGNLKSQLVESVQVANGTCPRCASKMVEETLAEATTKILTGILDEKLRTTTTPGSRDPRELDDLDDGQQGSDFLRK